MITIDNVQYRSLEEQVRKNKDDIQYILEEEGVLNQFGIKVVGEITNSSELPDPTTYQGAFGDAYAVGTGAPYTLYIYTRANGAHPNNYWFNIGEFPGPSTVPGPTGPQGPAGADGERGSYWYTGTSTPPPLTGLKLRDKYLNVSNGDVYSYSGSGWSLQGNIKGPQGIQGIQGETGAVGPQGPQGPQGPKGDAGQSFEIVGIVSSESQLPTPSTLPDNKAYLVGTAAPYDMYVQVNDQWVNMGIVEGVVGPQGPQGPQGIQGPQGPKGPQGIQGPKGKDASLTLNGSSNATPSFYAPTVDTGGRWLRGTGLGEPEWSLPINIQDSYTEISSDKTLPDLGVGHTGVICYFTSHSSPYTIYLPSSGEWAFAYQVSNSYYNGAVEEFSCAKSVAWHNSSGGSAIRVIKGNGKYTSIMIIYTRLK